MITCMLAGLWVLCFFALRYPLKLIPILLFEFAWKTIWLLAFGLPQWMVGVMTEQWNKDIWSIGIVGTVGFGLIIPWTYVWRHYIKQPAERWR